MSVLRLLLMITLAAWIWLELVAVLGRTVVDRLRGLGRARDAGSVAVLLACVAAGLVAATRLARLDAGALPGPPEALAAAGLALMWAGLALRVWSIQHLGRLFSALVVIHPDHRLVTTGPYRLLRHPSYSGALLAAVGLGVALAHWTSLLVLVASWIAGIAYRIHVEEAALRETFGSAYEDYSARTRRLIPGLY
jgi:protein-S-isoprenylcysteine O-methyltransferase Ste14